MISQFDLVFDFWPEISGQKCSETEERKKVTLTGS